VGAGDEIKRISRDANAVPVIEIVRLYVAKRFAPEDVDSLSKIMKIESVPEDWKDYFQQRMGKMKI